VSKQCKKVKNIYVAHCKEPYGSTTWFDSRKANLILILKRHILIPMLKTTLLTKILTLFKKLMGSNLMQDCKTCKTINK
jgi:hypothetical protein